MIPVEGLVVIMFVVSLMVFSFSVAAFIESMRQSSVVGVLLSQAGAIIFGYILISSLVAVDKFDKASKVAPTTQAVEAK